MKKNENQQKSIGCGAQTAIPSPEVLKSCSPCPAVLEVCLKCQMMAPMSAKLFVSRDSTRPFTITGPRSLSHWPPWVLL